MLGVEIKQYQIKPLAIIVACLLTGQTVYAEDESLKKKEENIDEQAAINLSQVVVQVTPQSIIGIDQGLGASEVGRSTLNQTQLDIIQGSNMASVLDKMPGVTMGGESKTRWPNSKYLGDERYAICAHYGGWCTENFW